VHRDAIVKNWVRLATENFYGVSEIGERLCEVTRVDTLSTNMRFTAIREVCNTQRAIGVVGA
jgi:hypothetical protein